MFFDSEEQTAHEWIQLSHCAVDRGSKYSATGGRVESGEDVKAFLKRVKSDKKYLKATHNIYAARYVEDGKVVERKSDDGETGAGMVILRILRQTNFVNVVVVVTRWYGGVKLHADRFKHVQDSTRLIVEELKNSP